LAKIANPQVKQFIEKCLVPASERSSAKELLQDPFLCLDNKHGPAVPTFSPAPKAAAISLASLQMDVDTCESSPASSGKEKGYVAPHAQVLEFTRTNKNTELKLKGEKLDNSSVSLVLRIADLSGMPYFDTFLFEPKLWCLGGALLPFYFQVMQGIFISSSTWILIQLCL